MNGYSHPGCGFTLVELQIALALFVMMLGVLYGGLHIAQASQGAVSGSTERQLDRRVMDDRLRRQLAGIVPVRLEREQGADLLFTARNDTLRYLTTLPMHAGVGGLYWSSLEVADKGDEPNLMLVYCSVDWDRLARGSCAGEPERSLLMSGVKEIRFAYFGRVSEDAADLWHETWDSRTTLPVLIRITLALVDRVDPAIWTYRVMTQVDPSQKQFLFRRRRDGLRS